MIFERLWKLKQKKVVEANQAEVMLKDKKASKKVVKKLGVSFRKWLTIFGV